MTTTPAPSPKAAALWYLWSSAFNMAMSYSPRWTNDTDPYEVHFPETYGHTDFVRLNEEEAQWLINMKAIRNG